MDGRTRDRLRALNRRFYRQAADAFDTTRDHAWPGWAQIPLPVGLEESGVLRVLDVGCGNARLASALHDRIGDRFEYTGLDESPALLERARARLERLEHVRSRLLLADLLEGHPGDHLPEGPFDWVTAFGLLHHVPGRSVRVALLKALATRVAAGGLLVFTAWQFAHHERFSGRILPWSALDALGDSGGPGEGDGHGDRDGHGEGGAEAEGAIDVSSLEPGDHLLGFGDQETRLRYCHHCDEAELDALEKALPLTPLPRLSADGRSGDLNRYVMLRRDAPPDASNR